MKSLLWKTHFGHIFRKFLWNRATIRLKFTNNMTQNGFPSLRLSFSGKLLEVTNRIGNILFLLNRPVRTTQY